MKKYILSLFLFIAAFAQAQNTLPTLSRNNVWTGTNTYTQGKLVLGPSGQSCSPGSYMTGFSNTFAPVCQVVSGAGVTSFNGLTGSLTLTQGTNITITQTSSTNLTISASGSGGGGSGTVSAGSIYNFPIYGFSSSTTVQPSSNYSLAPYNLTSSQMNSLISAFGSQGTIVIPNGFPEQPFTNTNANAAIVDTRLAKNYIQLSSYGIACDARQVAAQTTVSSTTITQTGLQSNDVGKTMAFTGTISGVQATFDPTIVSVGSGTAVISVAAPFTSTNPSSGVTIGTDNTTAIQNGLDAAANSGENAALLLPANCYVLTHTINWDHGQTVVGQSGNQLMSFIGFPGEDVFTQKDVSGGGFMGADGSAMEDFQVWVDGTLDATQPITQVDASGNQTSFAGFYRPAAPYTAVSNNPLAPGWAANATNGVASTTQNSAVICVPNALGRLPVTGQTIVFPNLPSVFTATVSSTAGSCSAGNSPITMSAAFPNLSTYTKTQTEWVSTTSIQTTAASIPTSLTYPYTLALTNSTAPVPAFESNVATHGRVKVGAYEFDYVGDSQVSPYSLRLVDGPATTTGIASGATIVPENPCPTAYEYPWPVIPDLNTGDSTPSGAQFFPGFCLGNAAFSLPTANAYTYSANASFYNSTVSNINIKTWPQFNINGGVNNNVGWYFAGNNKPYSTTFDRLKINGLAFGLVQGPASVGQHNIAQFGPTGDGNIYSNCSIHAGYPLIFDDSQNGSIDTCDTYTSAFAGPGGINQDHIGAATALMFLQTIDETNGNVITGTFDITVTGWSSEPENGSHNEIPVYAEIDCNGCSFIGDNFEGVPTIIDGVNNNFIGGQMNTPDINYGQNNVIKYVADTLGGQIAETYPASAITNWGTGLSVTAPMGIPGFSMWTANNVRSASDGQTQDFAYQGNYSVPAVDPKAGMIYPEEFVTSRNFESAPMNIGPTFDATSRPTGQYVGCSSSGGCFTQHFDGSQLLYIGNQQRIPADLTLMEVAVKSTTGQTTIGLQVVAQANGSCGAAGLFNNVLPVTSSWTTYEALVDFTGKDGCNLGLLMQNPGSGVEFGYINFIPMPSRVLLRNKTYTAGAACAVNGELLSTDSSNVYWCESNVVVAQSLTSSGGGATSPGGTIGAIQYNGGGTFNGLNGTGLLKANGASAPSLATAGTDYVVPTGNISGTAANLSGTPALPNGTTGTTQTTGDNSTKLATDAFVIANAGVNPMTFAGDMIYGGTSGAETRLPGNTSTTRTVLSQVGTGSASTAPNWLSTTGTGNAVLATSPTLVTPVLGAATASSLTISGPATGIAGMGSATFALGASGQVGTGATTPVCLSTFICDSLSGTFSFATGTGSLTAGTILTVTLPGTRGVAGSLFNPPNCQVSINQGSGSATYFGVFTVPVNTSGTVTLPITVYTALLPSVTYTLTYGPCGGV